MLPEDLFLSYVFRIFEVTCLLVAGLSAEELHAVLRRAEGGLQDAAVDHEVVHSLNLIIRLSLRTSART